MSPRKPPHGKSMEGGRLLEFQKLINNSQRKKKEINV